MRIAASNIAWTKDIDIAMYSTLASLGYEGLEVAPTRLFPDRPYEHLEEASSFATALQKEHRLAICSMQSIWYGKQQRIFRDESEREELICYTGMALKFAKAVGCPNLVFGNPKNRITESARDVEKGLVFFKKLGDLAHEAGAVIALEPNPDIYGTNFLNKTEETASFVRRAGSPGLMMNLDFGTFLHNEEEFQVIEDNLDIINHVHISEPNLDKIKRSPKHLALAGILRAGAYGGFVSLEMSQQDRQEDLMDTLAYIREVFSE